MKIKKKNFRSNSVATPLSAEEQAVLVAIDPVNERLYARTPSNASPARADTPIPDSNANDDPLDDENELDDKIDENGPETLVNTTTIFSLRCVHRFVRIVQVVHYCHVFYAKS